MAQENFSKRRFIRGEHNQDDISRLSVADIQNMQIGAGNMMFKETVFPLTYD